MRLRRWETMTIESTLHPRHPAVQRAGAMLAITGFVLVMLSLLVPPAQPARAYEFQGTCIGTEAAGTCVLDEPEGKDPAVHGTVTYLFANNLATFTVAPLAPISEMQICMQTSGPFAQGANVCAGSHGNHVAFTQLGNVYAVDLAAAGFGAAPRVYWTLHVVSGGRTLQVNGTFDRIVTTTTTAPPTTTSTTSGGTTTTAGEGTTTTTVATTTSTGAATTAPSATTIAPTPTTSPLRVGGEQFARTGSPEWLLLVGGAGLLVIGLTLLVATRVLGPF